jgi:hypothetical protein
MMKYCTRCETEKLGVEFNINRNKSDGLQKYCRDCQHELFRNWYDQKQNKSKQNSHSKNFHNIKRERLREKVWNYLLDHPCVGCGEKNPLFLDFDHNEGEEKVGTITFLVGQRYPWEVILNEIKKCTVRCCKCHRIKTAKDFNWISFSKKKSKT